MNPAVPPPPPVQQLPPPVQQLPANRPCWKTEDGTVGIDLGIFRTAAGTEYRHLRTRHASGAPHNRYFPVNNLEPAQIYECNNIPRQIGLVLVRQNAVPVGGRRQSRRTRRHRTRRHRKN